MIISDVAVVGELEVAGGHLAISYWGLEGSDVSCRSCIPALAEKYSRRHFFCILTVDLTASLLIVEVLNLFACNAYLERRKRHWRQMVSLTTRLEHSDRLAVFMALPSRSNGCWKLRSRLEIHVSQNLKSYLYAKPQRNSTTYLLYVTIRRVSGVAHEDVTLSIK